MILDVSTITAILIQEWVEDLYLMKTANLLVFKVRTGFTTPGYDQYNSALAMTESVKEDIKEQIKDFISVLLKTLISWLISDAWAAFAAKTYIIMNLL